MEYFKHFPKLNYRFGNKTIQLTDLLTRVTLSDLLPVDQDLMYKYIWQQRDEIDSVADRYYETVDLWWLVLMSNNIHDPYEELPIEDQQFTRYVINKYRQQAIDAGFSNDDIGVLEYTKTTTFEYRDSEGDVIDQTTFSSLPASERREIPIFEHELEKNDKRREYLLLTVSLGNEALDQLEEFLRELQ